MRRSHWKLAVLWPKTAVCPRSPERQNNCSENKQFNKFRIALIFGGAIYRREGSPSRSKAALTTCSDNHLNGILHPACLLATLCHPLLPLDVPTKYTQYLCVLLGSVNSALFLGRLILISVVGCFYELGRIPERKPKWTTKKAETINVKCWALLFGNVLSNNTEPSERIMFRNCWYRSNHWRHMEHPFRNMYSPARDSFHSCLSLFQSLSIKIIFNFSENQPSRGSIERLAKIGGAQKVRTCAKTQMRLYYYENCELMLLLKNSDVINDVQEHVIEILIRLLFHIFIASRFFSSLLHKPNTTYGKDGNNVKRLKYFCPAYVRIPILSFGLMRLAIGCVVVVVFCSFCLLRFESFDLFDVLIILYRFIDKSPAATFECTWSEWDITGYQFGISTSQGIDFRNSFYWFFSLYIMTLIGDRYGARIFRKKMRTHVLLV